MATPYYTKIETDVLIAEGGGGAGAYSQTIAFTASVPFTFPTTIMNHTVAGAIVFSPNTTGAVAGNGACIRLVSNGVNIPTFDSAFKLLTTSDTYSNVDGRVHDIVFFYNGTDYVYSIAQSHTIDTNAPTVLDIVIEAASPTILTITANELLNESSVPTTTAFTVSGGKTVTNVAIVDDTISLTVNTAYAGGDTITVSYAVPGSNMVKDLAGNNMASFTNHAVTNNISTQYGTDITLFAKDTLLTVSGTEYISDAAAYTRVSGVSNQSLAGDGVFVIDVPIASDPYGPEFGMKSAQTVGNYTTFAVGLIKETTQFRAIEAGATGTLIGTTIVNDDKVRLRRTGTTVVAEYYRGGTWNALYTFSTAVSGTVYMGITAVDDGSYVGKVVNPRYL